MAFNIGDTVGDYEIIGILGAGGMGKVYKVRNVISDRVEALKVLLPDLASEAELADRFIREIKVLASLNHPNIAGLHTALRLNNQLLMVMEFVEGRTLEDRMKEGVVPVREAVGFVCQALSALGFAHERGIVHRDIKPANMMVTPSGELKLMDFGIAKAVADRRLTMTGTTLGSLYYMSPEQVKGSAEIDGRSDLYSMGVSLYELVTGTRPFKGDSDYSIMVAHLEQQPVPPVQLDPTLPPALNEIILTAIQKEASKRFRTAQAFRAALEDVARSMGAPVPASPAAAQPAAQPPRAAAPPPQPPPQGAPPRVPPPQAPLPMGAGPAFPPPIVPAPAGPARSGHRGLWMALGAVVVLAVIAVAALQLPRILKTHAGGAPATQDAPAAQAPAPVTTPEAASPQAAPAPEASTPAPAAAQPAVGAVPAPVPARPAAAAFTPRAAPKALKAVAAPAAAEPAPGPAQASPRSAPPPQEAAQSAPPAANDAALEELQDRMGVIGPRANALRSSLKNLENEQRAQGVGMRSDISAAWKRMEYLLDEAEAALKNGDAARARKNLDAAEREADKLDKFLGH